MTQVGDRRSTRWSDHRVSRREALVGAARRAVHRHGPEVSMAEIAATAGTSKSIVYRYFRDKHALRLAVGSAVVAQMHTALEEAAALAETPRAGLRAMVDIYLEMAEASPNVYWFLTRPPEGDPSLGRFLDEVVELIAGPFARLRTEPLADAWAAGAVGFVRGVGEWWLLRRGEAGTPSREELAEWVTRWLWVGFARGEERA